MELVVDAVSFAWWLVGTVVLGIYAGRANAMDVPKASSRNAVVAMAAINAMLDLIISVLNNQLIAKLGGCHSAES